jgi:hypothetical protein
VLLGTEFEFTRPSQYHCSRVGQQHPQIAKGCILVEASHLLMLRNQKLYTKALYHRSPKVRNCTTRNVCNTHILQPSPAYCTSYTALCKTLTNVLLLKPFLRASVQVALVACAAMWPRTYPVVLGLQLSSKCTFSGNKLRQPAFSHTSV